MLSLGRLAKFEFFLKFVHSLQAYGIFLCKLDLLEEAETFIQTAVQLQKEEPITVLLQVLIFLTIFMSYFSLR